MAGGTGAAATVKETGTVTGVTPVPPLSVTVPLWVPTAREPVAAVNVTRPLPVPEPGLRVNHVALSLALQVKVPPPVLLMLRV
jgi:hypothetical protein